MTAAQVILEKKGGPMALPLVMAGALAFSIMVLAAYRND